MVVKNRLSTFGKSFHKLETSHGSFFDGLFNVFILGSSDNKQKIVNAFPEYFNVFDVYLDYPYEGAKLYNYEIDYTYDGSPGKCICEAYNSTDVKYQFYLDAPAAKINAIKLIAKN